uniref:Uncharacterized protein n=1 Tax=Arundo donax TaxID=35708 RepID=A0A0A8ZXD6_ARUDO
MATVAASKEVGDGGLVKPMGSSSSSVKEVPPPWSKMRPPPPRRRGVPPRWPPSPWSKTT